MAELCERPFITGRSSSICVVASLQATADRQGLT
jgi:hypothetical protein